MNRRNFLQSSALLSASAFLPLNTLSAETLRMKNIGIQLFSLPKLLDQDFEGGIKMLAQMGYKELELFGPYPFSAESAKKGWEQAGAMLGFSGSGYFGRTPKEVKQILDDNSLSTPSVHTDLDTLQTQMGKLGEAADILGFTYAVLPAIPDDKRKNLDDYKKIAEDFNKIGEEAKKAGIKFGYHNHGYGISEMEGKVPLKLILEETDPNLVFFEMDIYWTTAGGIDPVELLEAYPKRYKMMHVKDMKEKKRFSGDGNDMSQWMELFPYMTTAGDGVMNLEEIIEKGKKAGVKHFFVEQDLVSEPKVALKKSIDYLKKLS